MSTTPKADLVLITNSAQDEAAEVIPESIPATYGTHWPGHATDRPHVKKALFRLGVVTDARRPSEIARVHTRDGSEQYDLPTRSQHQLVTSRVKIIRSKEITVAASVIARNAIRCTEIYEDKNKNAHGLWIKVTYVDIMQRSREVFDRIEAFTTGEINDGPWADMQKFGGVTEKDIKALREYLATHVTACVNSGDVKIAEGTSHIGWSDDFRSYSRPGYMDPGVKGLYSDSVASSWTGKGDLLCQQHILLNLFAESPRALMIAGFATAGLILRPLGINENYILSMVGPDSSSLGKSTLLRVIKSFYTSPARLSTFDSTTKALKASTLYANDSCALIDEIGAGKLDPKERDALVYGLSMGVPRDYLIKEGGEWRPRAEKEPARYTVLLSGEESLIDATKAKKGVKIRYTQLSVSEQKRVWAFNDNERIEDAMRSLDTHHGHIFPEIVQMIQESAEFVSILREAYDKQLKNVRERCGKSEKAKRKAHQVALAQLGIVVLQQVIDTEKQYDQLFGDAVEAAHELLDDFIQEETTSDLLEILLNLPTTLAPNLAVDTYDGVNSIRATVPQRMIGSAFHGMKRYQHENLTDSKGNPVKSISDKPPTGKTGVELKGTVITLTRETAAPVIQEKLGVDLMALVDKAISMGWAKLRPYEKGFRKSPMTKFIVDSSGRTRNNSGYEIIIPDDYELDENEIANNDDTA